MLNSRFTLDMRISEHIQNYDLISLCKLLVNNITVEIAFQICSYYHVIFDEVLNFKDGSISVPGVNEPIFEIDSDKFNFKRVSDHAAIHAMQRDFRLSRAMRLATLGLEHPYDTFVFCRMAVELVARQIEIENSQNPPKEKINWKYIKDELLVTDEMLISTRAKAAQIRHGDIVNSTWAERKEALEVTWDIISNFDQYLKDKSTRKPKNDHSP